MMALARIAANYPKTLIFIVLLVTLAFASQLKKLQIDDDILNMIPADHPARLLQENIEQQFELRDLLILAVENSNGVFNPESLTRIKQLSDYLQAHEDIIAEDVASLSSTDNIIAFDDELLLAIFAVLNLSGGYIDIPLAVLAAISLGLAVDYAIYILDRYRSIRRNAVPHNEAVLQTLAKSGSIVLFWPVVSVFCSCHTLHH